MKLLVDVGNTAVKWACLEGGGLQVGTPFGHADGEFATLAERAWGDLGVPASVHIASVAGDARDRLLADWMRAHWQRKARFLQTTAQACGVSCGYREPAALGVDRWVAMIGAFRQVDTAVVVVDCGTAITIDLLLSSGRHRGGMILPGTGLLRDLLQDKTANIDAAGGAGTAGLLSDNTGSAVRGGALYIAAAAVERVVQDMRAQAGESCAVLVTGGDAPAILALLRIDCVHTPDLVLQGLAEMTDGRCP